MAAGGVFQVFFALVLACLFDQVSAFDGGDAAALIIGLIFGIMAICACLGAYARRQQGVWRAISNRTHFEQREEVLERDFWEIIVDIFTSYMWNSIPSAFHLIELYFSCGHCRSNLFPSDVGNSVFGRIRWTNNVRTNWGNIWTVLDTIDDAIPNVADFKEFFAHTCMILPSFWMLAQLVALKLNTCATVTQLYHSHS